MAEFPALPLWTDAYIADTLDLSLEDHGFYLLMLMMAWRRPDNALPDDMAWLKRALSACCAGGIHGHTFNARVPRLLQRFWCLQDGKWHQKRLDRERSYLADRSEKQRQIALKRWSNESQTEFKRDSNSSETHSSSKQNQRHSECEGNAPTPTPTPTPTKERKTPPLSVPQNAAKRPRAEPASVCEPEGFAGWYAAYPRKVGRDGAVKAYRGALAKAAEDELLDGLRRACLAWERCGTEARYIPHPATWLNRRGWADEDFQAGTGSDPINESYRMTMATIQKMRENNSDELARNGVEMPDRSETGIHDWPEDEYRKLITPERTVYGSPGGPSAERPYLRLQAVNSRG